MDTSDIPEDLRVYLPLLLESLLELPIERNGVVIPYEQVVAQLNHDTVAASAGIGLTGGSKRLFRCGNYSNTITVALQVEANNYDIGVNWLKEILYKTIFTADRLKVVAQKMYNSIAQAKRSGRDVVAFLMKALNYLEGTLVPVT